MKLNVLSVGLILILLNISLNSQTQKWKWINPYPTGALVNQTWFIDEQKGFIIGEAGTLMRTTDGGTTWYSIDLGTTTANLFRISFSDAFNGRILGTELNADTPFFARTTDGGITWTQYSITTDLFFPVDIFFVNSQYGWCLDNLGKVFKTTNGGQYWINRSLPNLILPSFQKILFVNQNDGYVFGSTNNNIVSFTIARTTNGGTNWSIHSGPPTGEIFIADILNDSSTIIANNYGLLLRSTDYCDSWTFKMNSPVRRFYSIDFLNQQYGMIGTDSGNVFQTSDGGINWNQINIGFQTNINSIQYISQNFLTAAGHEEYDTYTYILTSTNQGSSWSNHTRNVIGSLTQCGIEPIDSLTAFIYGIPDWVGGSIYKTTDGGLTWYLVYNTSDYPISDVKSLNDHIIFASGGSSQSIILKSIDSGETWMETAFNNEWVKGLSLIDSSAIFAFTNSVIYKSTNLGAEWNITFQPTEAHFRDLEFTSSLVGYCAGGNYSSQLHKTTDGGSSWLTYNFPTSDFVEHLSFPSEMVGYGVTWGKVYKTINGGISWNMLISPYVSWPDIVFNDELNGWITGGTGVYKTSNGGQTWEPEILHSDSHFSAFGIKRNRSLWLTGSNADIIKYTGELSTAIAEYNGTEIPREFSLLQNYPNPFNPTTRIRYDVPRESRVVLKIYDVLGAEVATLINENLTPGKYTAEWNAGQFASGVYIYRMDAEGFSASKKLILVK
ncbi:MAG TPA: YCF48-related protein [Ignavibacteriaceae bacterium]|nr:YCF48-related protein [Ignavibacteriaceae bacterium]